MVSVVGNRAAKFFREGHYEDAAQAYTDELALLSQAALPNKKLELLYNRSSCYLKLKQYGLVIEDCTQILEQDNHQKAFSRKVSALRKLGYYSEAHKTARTWLSLNPDSSQAEQEVERLQTLVNALDDPDEDIDIDLLNVELSGERVPPEGREDDLQLCSPNTLANNSNVNNSTKDNGKSFYCEFCGITFQTKPELALHCRSDLHRKKIVSDEGRDWKYRPPPRGLSGDEYSLCLRDIGEGKCRFGEKCVKAHSEDELAEWKERFEFKKSKVQKAKEIMLVGNSYSDQLMEKLMKAEKPDMVMVSKLDSVNFQCSSSLKIITTHKRCSEAWLFTIASRDTLRRVCLLDDQHRHLYNIAMITVGPKKMQKAQKLEDNCQEWTSTEPVESAQKVYRIKIAFRTEIYGTFRQTIVFDFGSEPVLVKEVCVDSAPVSSLEELTKQVTSILDVPRWDTTKIPLVEFSHIRSSDSLNEESLNKERKLKSSYPVPQATTFTPSQAVLSLSLSKYNYKARMHDLLYIEEMAQYSSIARYNVKSTLQLVQSFLLIPGQTDKVRHAGNGELIARMKLNSDLCEDTLHGRLILQNVFSVYLAQYDVHKKDEPDVIYEAIVEDRGKDFLMLRLSSQMVSSLKFQTDSEVDVQVQFHLNRVPMCQMHMALDRLEDPGVLFPEKVELPSIPWTPKRQWSDHMDTKLNAKQKEAIVAITTSGSVSLPPILIAGPYGTGKTYTLAQAAKQLLQNESSRILICTHSNSAADLYVREYFHPCVHAGDTSMRPLRIYYRHRRVDTVDHIVIQYCLITSLSANEVYFRAPTKRDIEAHRIVVVTLSTSQALYSLDLPKGYFTHILLDEAAQAMECETIMPLALAGPQTRVVMAGDHMQMSPEVHSDFVRDRNLHISLLERLYDLYPNESPVRILLCENYRSHKAIIDFTSELFYESQLVTSGKQPRHENFYPLTFFTARGEDEQHQNSTAYYNNAEVYEIVERVAELRNSWPKSWGPFQDGSIGVVAPYHDQVSRIRAELRKKKLHSVSVERVFNVQGKQFRVIFISTVRTRKTCTSDPAEEDQMDYGFLSNAKLLNTAITRAQSLVAVVGDPVSLCSVGKCRKLWERFIEICSNNQSLHGITWNQLRSQLDGVEIKKTYTLNPLAPEFVPNRLRHPIPGDASSLNDPNMTHAQMMQGIPNWMVRFGQMFPPMYRYPHPHVYPHMWHPQPQPQPMFLPGFFQPVRPNMLQWPQHYHLPQAVAAGSSPPSPARTKDTIKQGKESGASQPGTETSASKANGAIPKGIIHASANPHIQQTRLSLQARGSPIYIQNHPGHHLRGGMVPGPVPAWPHSFVGQPFHTRPMSPSPNSISPLSPVNPLVTEHCNGIGDNTSGRSSASLSPKSNAPQIQILPNVRHAPLHLKSSSAAVKVPSVPQQRHPQAGVKTTQAMISQSPHLQREFYSYIMQSQGVDAANNFLKIVQKQSQMGSSSPVSNHSPVPFSRGDHEKRAEASANPGAKIKQGSAHVSETVNFHDRPFTSASSHNHHHQHLLRSPPSPFNLNLQHQRELQHHAASAAASCEVPHAQPSEGDQAQSIDFSVPTDIDRILKMMEDSVSKQAKGQSPFVVPNSVQPEPEPNFEMADEIGEASRRQGTAPPLYMRGNDISVTQESTSPKPMSYAAVLRRKPQPPPVTKESTPENPLDLLKNLNIKASPGTQALYQYFS